MKMNFNLPVDGISKLPTGEDFPSLPNPLITQSGALVDSTQIWEQTRRAEILELFRQHVYGRAPIGRPAEMTFELLETDEHALDGTATRKQVRVNVCGTEQGPHIDILIYLPNHYAGPVPLLAGLNFFGNHGIHLDEAIIESTHYTPWGPGERGRKRSRWPIERAIQRGFGVATLHCADLDPDQCDNFKNGVHGAFDPLFAQGTRPDDAWGSVGAWAWGLSRAMDYFETDTAIDTSKVALLGHSRLGKAALWAGAQDERFSMVMSNGSGCTGASLSRHHEGETIAQINTQFPHWFCQNHKYYNDNEAALPLDQHMLLALIAPRPVYVASADQDAWADPQGEFLSCVYAEPVYKLYGLMGLNTTTMPALEQPINVGHVGYHIRRGVHDITAYDWECYMDYADRHWE